MTIEFIEQSDLETSFQEFQPKPEQGAEPEFTQVSGAAMRQENDIYNAYQALTAPRFEEEDDHSPLDEVQNTKYEQYLDSFVASRSSAETEFIKTKIDTEEKDREILADAGGAGLAASIASGLISPTTFLPGGVFYKGAKTSQVALKTARSTAVAGAGAVAIQEGVLQSDQELRTGTESAVAIGAGAILAGLLGGGAAAALSTSERQTLTKTLDNYQDVMAGLEEEFSGVGNRSVGAAQTDTRTGKLKDADFIKKLPIINQQDPSIRLKLSDSTVSRRAINDLAENPLENVENADFVASSKGGSVESRMKVWQGPLAQSLDDVSEGYKSYFFGKESGSFKRAIAPIASEVTKHNKLTYTEFKIEVGKALRRNDQHEISEVAQAAQSFRKNVFEPGKQQAIQNGLLDADVDVRTAQSYLTRVYNRELIEARRGEFKGVLQKHFEGQRLSASRQFDEMTVKGEKIDDDLAEFSNLSPAEIEGFVEDTIDRILGTAPGRTSYDLVAGPRGPLRERVLNIPDVHIENFLESDIELIGRQYTNTMSADVELASKFGEADLSTKIEEVREDYNKRISKAKTEKQRTALEAQKKDDIRDIEAVRDRLRGTYKIPDNPSGGLVRTGRVVRNLNYLRLLGGMTLSAIPDLGKVMFAHTGATNFINAGIGPMLANTKKWRIGAEEIKLAGTALDMTLDSRAMAIADVMDNYGRHSKFERMLSTGASKFGLVSLMAPWNATAKQVAGTIVMSRLLRVVSSDVISPKDIRLLASSSIDEELAGRIASEFKKHGQQEDALYLPNTLEWTDDEARRALRAAIVRDVDKVVVTPGQDKPLWMSHEVGGLIGQFKSFGVASVQRTLLAGIQQRDAAAFSGAMMMIALGGVSYGLKEKTAGRDVSDDPKVWLANAVDRSGLLGWLMDANNITEKLTGGVVGLSAVTGEQISRYQSRNVTGAFLGPTADMVADMFQVTSSAFKGDFTESDIRKTRRLIPLQNLFYLRSVLDGVESNLAGN